MIRDSSEDPARQRALAFAAFIAGTVNQGGAGAASPLLPIPGDASFRRFHRFSAHVAGQQRALIAVDAPPATENNAQYLRLGNLWHRSGLRVPEIIRADVEHGFFVVEDLGERRFADAIAAPDANVDSLYRAALEPLLRIQQLPDDGSCPPYEATRLHTEVSLFADWLMTRALERPPTAAESALLASAADVLVENLMAQPRVTVHRDYHSRNLVLDAGGHIGIVDYQDALRGPYAYDVVSLLRDCYVRLPDARVASLRDCYRQAATYLPHHIDLVTDFDHAGMQRHLKAIGIFARQWVRDGRPHYLADIPRVLDYLIDVGRQYPAPLSSLAELAAGIRAAVVASPRLQAAIA